jgi:hypothetical protein
MKLGILVISISLLFMVGVLVADPASSQQFPYAVPEAPEFDSEGNHVEQGVRAKKQKRRSLRRRGPRSGSRYAVNNNAPQPRVRTRAPAAPVAPRSGVSPRPAYRRPAVPAQPVVSRPTPPPNQVRRRQDCSRYPMMIANSRSEAQMRMTARQYLTCLINDGWNMDQAKTQVVSTIQTAYRPLR